MVDQERAVVSSDAQSYLNVPYQHAHLPNLGDPDTAFALSFRGCLWAAAASVDESRPAPAVPVIRLGAAPEVPGLLTEFRAPRESVGCWPLAIIT